MTVAVTVGLTWLKVVPALVGGVPAEVFQAMCSWLVSPAPATAAALSFTLAVYLTVTVRTCEDWAASPTSQPMMVEDALPATGVSGVAEVSEQAVVSALVQVTGPSTIEFGSMPLGTWSISDRL